MRITFWVNSIKDEIKETVLAATVYVRVKNTNMEDKYYGHTVFELDYLTVVEGIEIKVETSTADVHTKCR